MARDRSLTDILGPIEGDYVDWLVRSARQYATENIEKKTSEWIKVSAMSNKYTGYVSVTPNDIWDWIHTTDDLTSVILALCSEVRRLQRNNTEKHEETTNGEGTNKER